ncbi:MAG: polyphenol oxidase family protein [Patescibacteria group bacterium]
MKVIQALKSSSESRNVKTFFKNKNIDYQSVISARLEHGSKIAFIDRNKTLQAAPGFDGLATSTPGAYLSVTVADCFPVYLFQPSASVVGILHAGWRSIHGGIVHNALELLHFRGIDLRNLLVGIGPGIRQCHFKVQSDVEQFFIKYPSCIKRDRLAIYIDLANIIRSQMITGGVQKENIEDCMHCTACASDDYFSYRISEDKKKVKAMIAYIGLTYSHD